MESCKKHWASTECQKLLLVVFRIILGKSYNISDSIFFVPWQEKEGFFDAYKIGF